MEMYIQQTEGLKAIGGGVRRHVRKSNSLNSCSRIRKAG